MDKIGNIGARQTQLHDRHGSGLRLSRTKSLAPWNWVLRAIFRICYDRLSDARRRSRTSAAFPWSPTAASSGPLPGEERTRNSLRIFAWSRAERSAIASISSSDIIFFWAPTGSYAPGSSASTAARSSTGCTGLSRSLGAFSGKLEPYGLFPLDEYFHGPSRLGVAPHTPPCRTGPSILPERLQFPGVKRAA